MNTAISIEELKQLIDSKGKYVLIDVREPHEVAHGMIPTAINIPMHFIQEKLRTLNKDERIIFYCKIGGRSEHAMQFAREQGFTNAQNYRGSILEWSKSDPNVQIY